MQDGTVIQYVLVIICQMLALFDVTCGKYTNPCFSIHAPNEKGPRQFQKHRLLLQIGSRILRQPFLHFRVGTATVIDISGFVPLFCGVNNHIPVDLTEIKICFTTMLHFP